MRRGRAAAAAVAMMLVAGCGAAAPGTTPSPTEPLVGAPSATPPPSKPLRAGEHFLRLKVPEPYTPSAPNGVGTDDYRCFLLDPHLTSSAFVTGVNVLPGTPAEVHHVILFRVPPENLSIAQAADDADPGEGWTCFGTAGMGGSTRSLNDAPWIGAWAPGGGERVMAKDIGIPLAAGSRIIMQVHYNLLAGKAPDQTSAELRIASGTKHLKALQTMLLVAPVELPCRPGKTGALCDRQRAINDDVARFGQQAAMTVTGLQLICAGGLSAGTPGPVQHCDRTVRETGVIRAVAGHMHLLGKRISVKLNPGTPQQKTLLDIHPWDFDNQAAVPIHPTPIHPGDVLRVTCRHSQKLRDEIPALSGIPERYVVWGEGTTDEMCLGIVLYTSD